MAQEAGDKALRTEVLKRQIEALTTDIVDAIDVLTRELQRSLLMLADRVEQRMETIGFGRLSGPVVNDIQEGVKAEAKRFSEQARAKIQEITRAKAGLSGAADELSALAAMTESEREALRKRLQDEISASEKTRQELEAELAEARVRIADLEKRMQSQSTRDARRIDKLEATNKQLSESLKKAEAELVQLKDQSSKATGDYDKAMQQIEELKAKHSAASQAAATAQSAAQATKHDLEGKIKALTEQLQKAQEAEVEANKEMQPLTAELEKLRFEHERLKAERDTARQQLEADTKKLETAQLAPSSSKEEITTSKQELAESSKRVKDLEAQITKLTSLKESHEQKISDLEEQQKTLKELTQDRDDISKAREDLEKQLEKALAEIERMKEEYSRFSEIRDRLAALEARSRIQDILLQKDQHYIVLTTFATKIVEGKYRVSAKELGFSPTLGVSLAAWLDKFFLDLQEEELVSIHRTVGRGLPSADIEVSDKGRSLFEEAKEKAAL